MSEQLKMEDILVLLVTAAHTGTSSSDHLSTTLHKMAFRMMKTETIYALVHDMVQSFIQALPLEMRDVHSVLPEYDLELTPLDGLYRISLGVIKDGDPFPLTRRFALKPQMSSDGDLYLDWEEE